MTDGTRSQVPVLPVDDDSVISSGIKNQDTGPHELNILHGSHRTSRQEEVPTAMTKLLMPLASLLLSIVSSQTTDVQFWEEFYRLDYSYDTQAPNGPNEWGQVDFASNEGEWAWYDNGHPIFDLDINGNECEQDVRPSPVNLFEDAACQDWHEIRTRQIQTGDCTKDDITFELTPYGLKAYYPWWDDNCLRPTIQMPGLGEFILVWLEVHVRSEHVLDGRRFDAELQFVHMGGTNNTEMAIVSVLIDASARTDHDDFQWMLNQWTDELSTQTNRCAPTNGTRLRKRVLERATRKQQAHRSASSWEPNIQRRAQNCKPDKFGRGCEPLEPRTRMYPYSMWPSIWYFSYQGSITQPPCSTIVHWRIIDEPMYISRRQYKQLTPLITAFKSLACDGNVTLTSPRGENFRPLQQPSRRTDQPVAHCRIDNFGFDVFAVGAT